ncbi:nucleotidyltransferase [Mycobacterium dioxanotrophicus]|uniref:Nucleotidyltransferase n=1 Tax=Mycobacterium dioxanotrophicus TaxID=482462 RepID=A0A1Y0BWM8_9MYCO|nr:nucleotidyltransferase [Mycobacterium dioxanotrophicus]ART67298.1 nucleotidyltransferase [Mycobacterium dioxanotrophicus]
METLNDEFAQAVRNVTVHGEKRDRAIAAHTEVRGLLEADPELSDWGIDTILIGSYARQTARYPGKDVDVFLRFTNLSVHHSPEKIYNAVERVLVEQYGLKDEDSGGGRITRQSRSLKIDFPDPEEHFSDTSFAIDAVPAVPWQGHWAIPNRDRDKWDNDDKRWIKTDPVQFAADTNTLATASWSPIVGTTNAYRPIVRLLRQVRHVHLGGQRPGGLFVEIAAYYVWNDQLVTGTSWAELLASTLEQVSARLNDSAEDGLRDPVLGTPLKPALEYWQWTSAAQTFDRLATEARDALAAERCRAAKIWRDILGTNERGHVLLLPDGCDAAGFPVGSVTAVSAVGSNQPRGFALPDGTCVGRN